MESSFSVCSLEIIFAILCYLEPIDLIRFSQTNKYFQFLINQEFIWRHIHIAPVENAYKWLDHIIPPLTDVFGWQIKYPTNIYHAQYIVNVLVKRVHQNVCKGLGHKLWLEYPSVMHAVIDPENPNSWIVERYTNIFKKAKEYSLLDNLKIIAGGSSFKYFIISMYEITINSNIFYYTTDSLMVVKSKELNTKFYLGSYYILDEKAREILNFVFGNDSERILNFVRDIINYS